jgi:hypothetical protein
VDVTTNCPQLQLFCPDGSQAPAYAAEPMQAHMEAHGGMQAHAPHPPPSCKQQLTLLQCSAVLLQWPSLRTYSKAISNSAQLHTAQLPSTTVGYTPWNQLGQVMTLG